MKNKKKIIILILVIILAVTNNSVFAREKIIVETAGLESEEGMILPLLFYSHVLKKSIFDDSIKKIPVDASIENIVILEEIVPKNTTLEEEISNNVEPPEEAESKNNEPPKETESKNNEPTEETESENNESSEETELKNKEPTEETESENKEPSEEIESENNEPLVETVSENGIYESNLNFDSLVFETTTIDNTTIDNTTIDNTPPTIEAITLDETKFLKKTIITVIAKDLQKDGITNGSGLAKEAYSFNNGTTWTSSNTKEITENGLYKILVKDILGNTITSSVFVENLDNEPPTILSLSIDQLELTEKNVNVTIVAKDYQIVSKLEGIKESKMGIGLHEIPYSWDDGKTWTSSNTLEIRKNGTYQVLVRDALYNQAAESIKINNICNEENILPDGGVENIIYHKHTGGSKGGGCYGKYNERWESTGPVYGYCGRGRACSRGDSCHSCGCWFSSSLGWHCNCKKMISGGSTYKVIWYTLNCGKTPHTPLARLILNSQKEWVKEMEINSYYEILNHSIKVSLTPYRFNGKEPTSESLTVSENGIYQCELQADANANTKASKVALKIKNIDNIAPKIASISYNQVKYVDTTTVTVSANDIQKDGYATNDQGCGLAEKAYSYDDGKTWFQSNHKEIEENGVYKIKVRDILSNTSEHRIFIDNIDNQPPTITDFLVSEKEWKQDKTKIIVHAKDYHIIPLDPDRTTKTVKEGTEKIVESSKTETGIGLADKPYSWDGGSTWSSVNEKEVRKNGSYQVLVRDAFGNQVEKEIMVSNIDKIAPTVTINSFSSSNEDEKEDNTFIIMATAYDNESGLPPKAYSWDGGWTWTENNKKNIKEEGIYSVWVKDYAGNKKYAEYKMVFKEEIELEQDKNEIMKEKQEEILPQIDEVIKKKYEEKIIKTLKHEEKIEGKRSGSVIAKSEIVIEEKQRKNIVGIATGIAIVSIVIVLGFSYIVLSILFGMSLLYCRVEEKKKHLIGVVFIQKEQEHYSVVITDKQVDSGETNHYIIQCNKFYCRRRGCQEISIHVRKKTIVEILSKKIEFIVNQ